MAIPRALYEKGPVNFGPLIIETKMWVRTHYNALFWDTIFQPLGGCCALKFLHALQIDQALPAHTRTGREFPIKFQSWKFKIWPKIHRVSPCNFRASGSIPTKLFPDDVPRVRGDKIGISFGRKACPLKFGRAKKRPKFGAIVDKFQLWSRISPERLKISKIWKLIHRWQYLVRYMKKVRWTLVH